MPLSCYFNSILKFISPLFELDKLILGVPEKFVAKTFFQGYLNKKRCNKRKVSLTLYMNLMNLVRNNLVSENLFHTVEVTGIFKYVKLRVSPGANPGETFGDVAVRQPEFTKKNISGTIVGIWTLELYSGMSLDGFHLHFLSDDKKFSGHIINLIMTEGIIEIGKIDQVIKISPYILKHF